MAKTQVPSAAANPCLLQMSPSPKQAMTEHKGNERATWCVVDAQYYHASFLTIVHNDGVIPYLSNWRRKRLANSGGTLRIKRRTGGHSHVLQNQSWRGGQVTVTTPVSCLLGRVIEQPTPAQLQA